MEETSDEHAVSIQERQEIPMPEISPGSEYLVAFLHSAGTASATGMGLTGLSWQEIEAWVRCSDMAGIVTPRDLKAMYMLSRVYARECAVATLKSAKPPYVEKIATIEEVRELVSEVVEDIFANLMATQPAKPKGQ